MLDCCKKNKWFYFGLTIPSMLLYVLALAGPLLLGTLPASFYNWNLIKGNKDFVGLGNYTKLLGDETFIHSVVFTLILAVISRAEPLQCPMAPQRLHPRPHPLTLALTPKLVCTGGRQIPPP